MITVTQEAHRLILPIRVTPRGGKDCVLPYAVEDAWVKLKVSVPPEDGKANQAVIELLAKTVGLPKSAIVLVSGNTSRNKRFSLETQEPHQILAQLAQVMGTQPEICFQVSS